MENLQLVNKMVTSFDCKRESMDSAVTDYVQLLHREWQLVELSKTMVNNSIVETSGLSGQ